MSHQRLDKRTTVRRLSALNMKRAVDRLSAEVFALTLHIADDRAKLQLQAQAATLFATMKRAYGVKI